MRLGECHVENYGSYASLDFDYSNQALCLIYGPTGAGKSTLPGIAGWILYGEDGKGGSANDICSWTRGTSPTKGEIHVTLSDGTEIRVYRERDGKRGDLFWTESNIGGHEMRGKDLKDTQRLLETRMGVSSRLFFTGGFLHEFSEVGTFFTAAAKDRRAVLERVADLRLASLVAERTAKRRKDIKPFNDELQSRCARAGGGLQQAKSQFDRVSKEVEDFEVSQAKAIRDLEEKAKNFEKEQALKNKTQKEKWEVGEKVRLDQIKEYTAEILKIDTISDDWYEKRIAWLKDQTRCETCGGIDPKVEQELDRVRSLQVQNKTNGQKQRILIDKILTLEASQRELVQFNELNTYIEQAEAERKKPDPFAKQIEQLEKELKELNKEHEELQIAICNIETDISDLEQLQDLSLVLRGQLLTNAVNQLMVGTNQILDDYFDSELRVKFILEDDEIVVSISKSGYEANFKQLSKGQRCLLRLAFSVTVMESAANNAGVHLDTLAFDEALDGLDSTLKVKAFRLFEHLATTHSSVLVIDHAPELQERFTNKFLVTMEGDVSSVENVT